MKIVNDKGEEITVVIENPDDLWYLSTIIEKKDLVSGKTLRKVKSGEKDERVKEVKRIPMFLKIEVEKTEYTTDALRCLGTILEGPDDLPLGSHHTFVLEQNTKFTLSKSHWLNFQRKKLKEAAANETLNILLVIFDREEATIAVLKKYGHEILTSIKGDVQKKADLDTKKGSFYGELLKVIADYNARLNPSSIILASPSFWKEEFLKEVKDEVMRKKMISATVSSSDPSAINEVLKREEVKQALQTSRTSKEAVLIDELFVEIKKQGLAAYGKKKYTMLLTQER